MAAANGRNVNLLCALVVAGETVWYAVDDVDDLSVIYVINLRHGHLEGTVKEYLRRIWSSEYEVKFLY